MTDSHTASAERQIHAAGPEDDEASLRRAYLDLLKLCLCDLGGAATRTVTWTGDHRVFSRELTGEDQRSWRVEGKDWPQNGLSMVGLRRLDDLQACVESLVAEGVPGDLIEAGSWRGGTSIMMRATLDALGATDRTLYVADSFQGFPAPESAGAEADQQLEGEMSGIGYFAPALEQVKGYFARFGCERGVEFVPGFFEQTLAPLGGRTWSLIRLDADAYKATRVALEALYPGLATGGYAVIDDYFHPYLPLSCRRAVDEFRAAHGITAPIEPIDWTAGRWRREGETVAAVDRGEADTNAAAPRAVSRRDDTPIPTDRELQLSDRLEELRARLAHVEAELAQLAPPTLKGIVGWARRGGQRAIRP